MHNSFRVQPKISKDYWREMKKIKMTLAGEIRSGRCVLTVYKSIFSPLPPLFPYHKKVT